MLINKYLFVPGNNINFLLVLRNESTNVYSAKLFGIHRSICPEVFVVKEVFLKIIYTKYRYWGLFFKKVIGFQPLTLLKKRLRYMGFLVNFSKGFRTPIFQNTSERLLLYWDKS